MNACELQPGHTHSVEKHHLLQIFPDICDVIDWHYKQRIRLELKSSILIAKDNVHLLTNIMNLFPVHATVF
jgi:hypothetical protein